MSVNWMVIQCRSRVFFAEVSPFFFVEISLTCHWCIFYKNCNHEKFHIFFILVTELAEINKENRESYNCPDSKLGRVRSKLFKFRIFEFHILKSNSKFEFKFDLVHIRVTNFGIEFGRIIIWPQISDLKQALKTLLDQNT